VGKYQHPIFVSGGRMVRVRKSQREITNTAAELANGLGVTLEAISLVLVVARIRSDDGINHNNHNLIKKI
jgi:hypothetical protein